MPAYSDAPVILCFGDSLTAGFGVDADRSYPSLLQQRLDQRGLSYRVVNAGVSGDTTGGALSRLNWVMKSKPVLAIVSLGANDGFRGQSVPRMKANLERIIQSLKQEGVRVILGGMRLPPNYGASYVGAFEAVYPDLAAANDLPLIPFLLEGVAGRPELNQGDGIHPLAAGYEIVLENVWTVLEPLLPLAPP